MPYAIQAVTANQAVHYIAAACGFTSLVLLWLALLWGIMLRNGWTFTRVRHSTVYATHMSIALFGLSLGLVHAGAQPAAPNGPFVDFEDGHIRVLDLFVPFINPIDPIGIGIGVLALELFVAATLSLTVQKMLGFSRWRSVHQLTYVAYIGVVAHVLISGSDIDAWWAWGSVVLTLVILGGVWFITTAGGTSVRARMNSATGSTQFATELTVNVNAGKCARFGFCEQEAPEVFKLRSNGRLAYRAAVSEEHADALVRAVEVCPARAISLNRIPTSVVLSEPPADPDGGPDSGPRANNVASLAGRRGGAR